MANKHTQITGGTHLTTKLTQHNYPVWRKQVESSTLISLELEDFIIGDSKQPSKETKDKGSKHIFNSEYLPWYRKDQMIFSAILGSCSDSIQPLISSATTAREAWDRLHSSFASSSRSCIISLKSKLAKNPKGTRSITEFLQEMRSIADDLALAQSPVSEEDLMVHILSQLGDDYNAIAADIKVRDNPFSYAELFDKLSDYERALKETSSPLESTPTTVNYTSRQQEGYYRNSNSSSKNNRPFHSGSQRGAHQSHNTNTHPNRTNRTNEFCQYCNIPGYQTSDCRKLARFLRDNNVTNVQSDRTTTPVANVTTSAPAPPSWLFDTGASHHVTSNRCTLQYFIVSPSTVDPMKLYSKMVQDLCTGTRLMRGEITNGVYHTHPSPKLQLNATFKTTPLSLHHKLGHPSIHVFKSIVSQLGLSSHFTSNIHYPT
ncbi:hypothetical protein LXL04_027180 [Taraxacum kok-saghyz]